MFTVNEHKNICIAGLNRRAGYATDCIENSKTTVYFYDHEIKNYLLLTKAYKTLDSDAV